MLKHLARWRLGSQLLKGSATPARYASESSSRGNPLAGSEETQQKFVNPFSQPTPALNNEAISEISETKEDREKRLKVLQLEADIAHQEGRRVPALDFFQEHHWEHVLTLPTKSARIKYFAFLWQIEMKKESEQRKKVQRAEDTVRRKEEMRKEREENTHIIYGLGHTSMFLRIYDTTINHWQNNRLTRAMQFAPKIVLDCSYDEHMNNREASYAAKQLMLCFAENRLNDEPFDLHYCNAHLESRTMKTLQRFIPTMLNPEFPMNVHPQCFTELFPKQNLVYLTPHCREDLVTYNPDDVYVIGAMVDTMNNEPLSLAKAKRLGLRMAKLPLDRYLQWGSAALKHVPRRKVVENEFQHRREKDHWGTGTRARKLNMRVDHLLDFQEDRRQASSFATPQKVRQRREGMEFQLDTWATGKQKKKQRQN
ncbi:hypothetical protein M5D96_008697 [Drosophila gunungcola]|uniref:RNA (guanine-9-)-methyltransferase domain-containing protein 1 n=1 Tax=Drosophila gunungcola TaxID=103775 RepID=A0A9P9YLM9_9MUSC|nr:hypothetical protein M5D96_008697 [Drosophila gunungcola]